MIGYYDGTAVQVKEPLQMNQKVIVIPIENMEKPVLSPNLTIEDVHMLREYNYEMTKHMTDEERMDYYNKRGREVQRRLS